VFYPRFCLSFLLSNPPPPRSSLFPYTTLFRSARMPLVLTLTVPVLPAPVAVNLTPPLLMFVPPVKVFVPPRSSSPAPSLFKIPRSEEHTSELQSLRHLVCRLLLEKKKKRQSLT